MWTFVSTYLVRGSCCQSSHQDMNDVICKLQVKAKKKYQVPEGAQKIEICPVRTTLPRWRADTHMLAYRYTSFQTQTNVAYCPLYTCTTKPICESTSSIDFIFGEAVGPPTAKRGYMRCRLYINLQAFLGEGININHPLIISASLALCVANPPPGGPNLKKWECWIMDSFEPP